MKMNKYEEALTNLTLLLGISSALRNEWIDDEEIEDELAMLNEACELTVKLEKRVDELEKALDKASYQLMRFAECDRCPMKEDHCMITNWQCKDKWKEWLLKSEKN